MFHYCYKTTIFCDGVEKFYVGKHSTTNLNDGYVGSGILLNRIIKSHPEYEVKNEIISFFETSEDAFEFEELLIDELFELFEPGKILLNLKRGGSGGWVYKCGKEHPNFGKHLSATTRAKISNSVKYNNPNAGIFGSNHFNFGRKHSKATKAKISETKKGILNPNFGKTGSLSHLYGKTLSISNKKFKGWYQTPLGTFITSVAAGNAEGVTGTTIRKWCKTKKPGYIFIQKEG